MPTIEAPRFYRGYRAGLGASLAMTAWTPVVWFFTRRQRLEQQKLDGVPESQRESQASLPEAPDVYGESKNVGAIGIHEK